ncbi:uncharacterized protein PV09_01627 [Verruconis gallopava]|uniref:Phosphatidate cytidylyltransferase, mitochondrial n=1 Tax=Verruconis gallopava TaxID=253628 RepID=A0A0D2ALN9_9PEZI|nr:uncharacterized protein PV09_01627 [Verruconis gallopava]KIW07688.1 hypothetical protein PV09_01627 [Verruconis gallopava]
MALPTAHRGFSSLVQTHGLLRSNIARFRQSRLSGYRWLHCNLALREEQKSSSEKKQEGSASPTIKESGEKQAQSGYETDTSNVSLPPGWEDNPDWNITTFSQLPHRTFGYNQHMRINEEFKEALRQILWEFKAPIRYAFAYGSGVFSQSASPSSSALSPHPHPPEAIVKWQKGGGKMIDFIFGVSYTQHWHSLNLHQHRDHYSFLGSLGSGLVTRVQDNWGAGVYFNPYITVNGTLIKYGVVNLDTLRNDLSTWDTLYLAGRLQKPVKILRDDPKVRLANQINLISAVRTALLMLPEKFTERDLYAAITGISYQGDPRMRFGSENPRKVANIVDNQMANFRQLYSPLIEDLPNVTFTDPKCRSPDWLLDPDANCKLTQDMSPQKRGNMVRRLPSSFRSKLYFLYQRKFGIPGREYNRMLEASKDEDAQSFKRREGGEFDRRIAGESDLKDMVSKAIYQTVWWPSMSQTVKSALTAGVSRSWRYWSEKRNKNRAGGTEIEEEKSTAKATMQKGEAKGSAKDK